MEQHNASFTHPKTAPSLDLPDLSVYQQLFDGFVELVYVMDIDTKELLYVNKAGRERYQLDSYQGKPCYEVLHGCARPCAFCPNAQLRPHEFYTWEHHNEVIHRHVLLKDVLIPWGKHRAKMEIAYDVTEDEHQYRQLKDAYEIEQVTMACVQKLYESIDPKETMHDVLKMIGTYLAADRMYIFEKTKHVYHNTFEWCADQIPSVMEEQRNMQEDFFQFCLPNLNQKERCTIKDVKELRERYPLTYADLQRQNVHSIMLAPIFKKNQLIGCIGADNPDWEKFQAFRMLDTLCYFLSLSYEKSEAQQALMDISYKDGLTGLYNRNRYMHDLRMYEHQHVAVYGVVYMDINDLKGVNDRLGHGHGDALIKEAAGYLKQVFSKEVLYRTGGDEFIALIKQEGQKELEENIQKLRNLFTLSASCSVAIGYSYQADGALSDMIKSADERMYENKKEYYRTHLGNGRYRSLHDETLALQFPIEVEKAIHDQKFSVYLQPKASMDAVHVIGSEALVRYTDQQGNLVSPDQFIPILEQSHTIHLVDFYVFETVCQAIEHWLEEGHEVKAVSVNFSRFTLMLDDFVQRLTSIWARYAIPQNLLEIEIIERSDHVGNEYLIKVLQEIKALGFRVSIDDFGVKYSNLFLFTNTNIDTLKLDRSLIMDLEENQKSQMIIDALSNLCRNLHIQLIVEGVETKEQLSILQRLHCDGIQGYYFSRPIPLQEFAKRYVKKKDITSV